MRLKLPELPGNGHGENLQELRLVLKETMGIDLPAPARKTTDLEGRVVKNGVEKALQERHPAIKKRLRAAKVRE